ncbi:MAG: type III-A CRISPR-associated RAMP protein Csm3 [Synergistetes bacterium]|nr:type III-A CRISPR-associated RAMP protein Csm3 [Synergistota bacterium]
MTFPRFMGRVIIEGKIEAKTGLHIGGSKEVLEVGGVDLPVVKDPFGVPYIPGSSLKGKMRALLELKDGKGDYKLGDYTFENLSKFWGKYSEQVKNNKNIEFEGKPCACGKCDICKLFGVPANKNKFPLNPTRLLVKDAFLDEEHFKEKFESAELLELEYSEVKYENAIDRLTSVANPRQVERVPAGARFNFSMSVKLLSEKDADLLKTLITGMRLLEDDYLGGHGSRGHGVISFMDISIAFRGRSFYEGEKSEERYKDSFKGLSELEDAKIVNWVRERVNEEKGEGK